MRSLASVIGVMLWMVAAAPAAWAGDPGDKLGRGLANATLGFLSYPAHADACSQEQGDRMLGAGCVFKALLPTVGQHVLGFIEVVTFPIPFPWPAYAAPYGSPGELPWERAGRYRPNRQNPPIP